MRFEIHQHGHLLAKILCCERSVTVCWISSGGGQILTTMFELHMLCHRAGPQAPSCLLNCEYNACPTAKYESVLLRSVRYELILCI